MKTNAERELGRGDMEGSGIGAVLVTFASFSLPLGLSLLAFLG